MDLNEMFPQSTNDEHESLDGYSSSDDCISVLESEGSSIPQSSDYGKWYWLGKHFTRYVLARQIVLESSTKEASYETAIETAMDADAKLEKKLREYEYREHLEDLMIRSDGVSSLRLAVETGDDQQALMIAIGFLLGTQNMRDKAILDESLGTHAGISVHERGAFHMSGASHAKDGGPTARTQNQGNQAGYLDALRKFANKEKITFDRKVRHRKGSIMVEISLKDKVFEGSGSTEEKAEERAAQKACREQRIDVNGPDLQL